MSFTTSDGLTLRGWYVPSRNGAAVIAAPGRAGSQRPARLLMRHGYGVLLFDRRGEGKSDGDPNAFGWGADKDMNAAVAYLQRQSDVDGNRIGGIGLSVGAETLLQTAAESDGLKAVVADGAGSRSLREDLARPATSKWGEHPDVARHHRGNDALLQPSRTDEPEDASSRASRPGRCSSSTASTIKTPCEGSTRATTRGGQAEGNLAGARRVVVARRQPAHVGLIVLAVDEQRRPRARCARGP